MAEHLDVTLGEESPGEDASGGKKKSKLLIKIALIILALGVQTVAAYFTITFLFFKNPPANAETGAVPADSLKEVTKKEKEDSEGAGEIFSLTDLIVNPAGTMGRRYFVISMGLEVSNAKVIEELTAKEPLVRDALITLLTQKNFDYIADAANMETIRSEIQETVNKYLDKGKITKIYFTSYILQ